MTAPTDPAALAEERLEEARKLWETTVSTRAFLPATGRIAETGLALLRSLAELREQREAANRRADQYERDWYDAKAEFMSNMQRAVEAELEACARVCEERKAVHQRVTLAHRNKCIELKNAGQDWDIEWDAECLSARSASEAGDCAAAIRSRSTAPPAPGKEGG